MLTFFTTAKPFRGHDGIIQRNALRSWKMLGPDVEVILFGDEEGAAEVAKQLGLRHEPRVERNEFGTKLLDFLFRRARGIARYDILAYVNCDILLMQDFCAALQRVKAKHDRFLMVGRRWDIDLRQAWEFAANGWEQRLRKQVALGRQRTGEWVDYFAFTRGVFGADFPPLVVGRVFWDHWLVWKALDSNCPVVDVSSAVLAVHQNHDYGYHADGKAGVFHGMEAGRNHALAGGWKHLRTIADATEVLRKDGLRENQWRYWAAAKRYARQAARVLYYSGIQRAWFLFLDLTRPLRHKLGLRTANLQRKSAKSPPALEKQS